MRVHTYASEQEDAIHPIFASWIFLLGPLALQLSSDIMAQITPSCDHLLLLPRSVMVVARMEENLVETD